MIDCDCRIRMCLLDLWVSESWRLSMWRREWLVGVGWRKKRTRQWDGLFEFVLQLISPIHGNSLTRWNWNITSWLVMLPSYRRCGPRSCWSGASLYQNDILPEVKLGTTKIWVKWYILPWKTREWEPPNLLPGYCWFLGLHRRFLDRKGVSLNSKWSNEILLMEPQCNLLSIIEEHNHQSDLID